jgi:hypothetical protein
MSTMLKALGFHVGSHGILILFLRSMRRLLITASDVPS